MRILALTRYGRSAASSRQRMLLYLPYLRALGFEIDIEPLLDDQYLDELYSGRRMRSLSIAAHFARRAKVLRRSGYDLLWVQYELFPWLTFAAERTLAGPSVPMVVDYDDAWFHRYDRHDSFVVRLALGRKIDRVMSHANVVVVGNEYLAQRARAAGARRADIIPTVIDLEQYEPAPHARPPVIGWIGSPATQGFLHQVAPVIRRILDERPDLEFHCVGARGVVLEHARARSLPWSEDTEATRVAAFTIGIMPLIDGPFERGKCGYKLIQCMGCAVPVIASPVGVNRTIVTQGVDGFLAESPEDWYRAFRMLLSDEARRAQMGAAAREKIRRAYCLEVTAPRLLRSLESALPARATAVPGVHP